MASGKGVARHIHMYHYINIGYGMVWACALPDCTHFMPLAYKGIRTDPRVIGKKSICWECRDTFHITEDTLSEDKVRCIECTAGVKKTKISVEEQMANIALKNQLARDAEAKARYAYDFLWGENEWNKLTLEEKQDRINKARSDIQRKQKEESDAVH